jgi:excisionase family DNA binding protein
MNTIHKLLLSKKQAADVLSVSLRTIDQLIARKHLSIARIGKRVLIPMESLRQFASGRQENR